MTLGSVLFPASETPDWTTASAPSCLPDLALDRVIADIVASSSEYLIAPFFYRPLQDEVAVNYRQRVMRDVERKSIRAALSSFTASMRRIRGRLGDVAKAHYKWEGRLLFLQAALAYVETVVCLRNALAKAAPESDGLTTVSDFLASYSSGDGFAVLQAEAARLSAEVEDLRYTLHIRDGRVTVRRYSGEGDYSTTVGGTFARFRNEAVQNFLVTFRDDPIITHVDAWILDGLATVFKDTFDALSAFFQRHQDFLDQALVRFELEIHVYLSWLAYLEPIRARGLTFCYPILTSARTLSIRDGFDLALATARATRDGPIVVNDVDLAPDEQFIVITGPNQGGKTTFARMIGQVAYLASLGLPVPGSTATLHLCDQVFTHFAQPERVGTQRGRLHDDLVRLRRVLSECTADSLVILNELFSSTTLEDAIWLSRQVLDDLSQREVRAVWVTFLSELASYNGRTASYVGLVDPDDPSRRTYRVQRGPASDTAYALLLADKHGVTAAQLGKRLER